MSSSAFNPPGQSHWTPTLHLSVNREDKAPGHVTNDTSSGSWWKWRRAAGEETEKLEDATPSIKSGLYGTRVNESDWIRNGGFPSSTSKRFGPQETEMATVTTPKGKKVLVPVTHLQDSEIAAAANLTPGAPTNIAARQRRVVCNDELSNYEKCLLGNDGNVTKCNDPWESFLSCQDKDNLKH